MCLEVIVVTVELVLHAPKLFADVARKVLLPQVAPQRVVIVETLAAKLAQGVPLEGPVALVQILITQFPGIHYGAVCKASMDC